MSKKIENRLAVLKAAPTLEAVPTTPPDRCHQLSGDRKGQFAVDLVQPFRIIFEPNVTVRVSEIDGGIDKQQVTAITIVDVADYH